MSPMLGRRSRKACGRVRTRARSGAERQISLSTSTQRKIVSLDLDAHTATDDAGESHSYERLLLATGGTPRRFGSAPDDVIYYRTLDTYHRLRALAGDGVRVTVIGGGFIGSEIAAALAMNDCAVTIVFPTRASARGFFLRSSRRSSTSTTAQGVASCPEKVAEIARAGDTGLRVVTVDGRSIDADVVVAGLGIEPRTDLAEEAGLALDDGVLVDENGRVEGRDDVFAAGDVARFPATLGGLRRVEHENHATTHGRYVGANMAGADTPYDYLPFFYSDLFDLGYEAVGDVDSRLDTVVEWAEPNRKGVVCYVEDDKPRGFLLWDGQQGRSPRADRRGSPGATGGAACADGLTRVHGVGPLPPDDLIVRTGCEP